MTIGRKYNLTWKIEDECVIVTHTAYDHVQVVAIVPLAAMAAAIRQIEQTSSQPESPET